jgi:hypothetical protein
MEASQQEGLGEALYRGQFPRPGQGNIENGPVTENNWQKLDYLPNSGLGALCELFYLVI